MGQWKNTMMCGLLLGLLLLLLLVTSDAFTAPAAFVTKKQTSALTRGNFATPTALMGANNKKGNIFKRVLDRFDTLEASGIKEEYPHHPPLVAAGLKWKLTLVVIGFFLKWYRARFIEKIPMWDRQPAWNIVVTNREQEKALRAYTCKTCGATLFIARNREWFFEGATGLRSLGCYTCGAKGVDNFVMDRDRIVEEVGDEDDYFDYERPLDFVSRAERRALLKKTKGNEEEANKLLNELAAEDARKEADKLPPMLGDSGGKEGSSAKEDVVDAEIIASVPDTPEATEEPQVVEEEEEEPVMVEEEPVEEDVPEPPELVESAETPQEEEEDMIMEDQPLAIESVENVVLESTHVNGGNHAKVGGIDMAQHVEEPEMAVEYEEDNDDDEEEYEEDDDDEEEYEEDDDDEEEYEEEEDYDEDDEEEEYEEDEEEEEVPVAVMTPSVASSARVDVPKPDPFDFDVLGI